MQTFRGAEVEAAPADVNTFVGRADVKRLASADEGTPVVIYHVAFHDGSRTNWHAHSGPQWLIVLEGRIRVQRWGESVRDVGAGDAVVIAPGEKHWHGSAPGHAGIHVAVNVDVTTKWFEPVSDEQYRAAQAL